MNKRIAFVYYPHSPELVRLETMPFALNTVRALGRAGWKVDVFLWQRSAVELKNRSVRNLWYRMPGPLELRFPKRAQPVLHAIRFGLFRSYACVFGVGQIGLFVANAIARVARCPLVYLNDEFPSCWPESVWDELEKAASRRADMIVTPDPCRNSHLLRELGLAGDKPTGVLFNTAELDAPLPDLDWHARLGIAPEKKMVLHAGSLADWAQVPELLATVAGWPEDVVLLLHSRSKAAGERYRRELAHLDIEGRVLWFNESLSEAELHSLISASLASLGLYRNTGPNIDLIGYSSGKLMRSLVCGTPVIASKIESLAFVSERGLGINVKHPAEIGEKLSVLIADREGYRQRCLDFARSEIAFEHSWRMFVPAFESVSGLDLARSPTTGPASGAGEERQSETAPGE